MEKRKYGKGDQVNIENHDERPVADAEFEVFSSNLPSIWVQPNAEGPAAEFAKSIDCRNVVVRDVRDSNGNKLGTVLEPHDATEAGVIAAAQRATDRMYAEYPEASNIESRIGATDATGRPKWSISPNFKHLAEVGTHEASYIWGDVASGVI